MDEIGEGVIKMDEIIKQLSHRDEKHSIENTLKNIVISLYGDSW